MHEVANESDDENDKTLTGLDLLAHLAAAKHCDSLPVVDQLVAPLSLSEIAADDSATHCDICQCPLDALASPDTRALRCYNCVLGVQCETCCATAHLQGDNHILQEWDRAHNGWGVKRPLVEFMSTLAKNCSQCDGQVAARGAMVADGTMMCGDCGPKLFCRDCSLLVHRRKPLHGNVKVWESGWRGTTLAKAGLIFQLGHGMKPCSWPLEPPAPMVIVTMSGCHSVNMKFCGCGNFEPGEAGRAEQLRAMGLQKAGIEHPQVWATFPVLPAAASQVSTVPGSPW
ncbi:hypothetical protein C8F04DRAFT_1274598 [Mycena alexandri]|uniref:CxC2-like cysteine cluster KDZ transposase-associated domain-containing protein n=1 Tax=Mycena alexandri TaxID=1745969 RepID=A0AAD6S575_9AGAR|nr:hypothetical protein C8F04DRAFT_1274598 [Mycena alexandri]